MTKEEQALFDQKQAIFAEIEKLKAKRKDTR